MEKRKERLPAVPHRGLMEALLRRRDPAGDLLFDPDAEPMAAENEE